MCAKQQVETSNFFARHPVFTLRQAVAALAPDGDRPRIRNRLRYHVEQGTLRLIERELYAVAPAGGRGRPISVDALLAAAAVRPDGIFAHHAALELLGAAHSIWRRITVFTTSRRRSLTIDGCVVRFVAHPKCLRESNDVAFATRSVEHAGEVLRVTGPERTLVEGFRDLPEVGGPEEFVTSAAGIPALDLNRVTAVLERYDLCVLWSAVGWFLERHRRTFHVDDAVLSLYERHRSKSPQYLVRGSRGGRLSARWNLILPDQLVRTEAGDDR
jgi:predicted transcriptional regulator of viral defense system